MISGPPEADAEAAPESLQVPFNGPGQLLTIWDFGEPPGLRKRALVLTRDGVSQTLDVDARHARWRNPNELLVEAYQDSRKVIMRLGPEGKVLQLLNDTGALTDIEPSPDGRWLVAERVGSHGREGLDIRDLAEGFVQRNPRAGLLDPRLANVTHAIWSPDGQFLAVAILTHEHRGLVPRLAILHRDGDSLKVLPGQRGQEEPGGVVPLFWQLDGIYARSSRGLLRCDLKGAGCSLVYEPGEARFAFAGTPAGEEKALLLVQDLKSDPLDVRAKEIHEVDLSTGIGRVLLRLPEQVFISDIDWCPDLPRAESGHRFTISEAKSG
jgi:hypothetical protein